MKVKCNLLTKKIEAFYRWGDIIFNPATHIVLDVDYVPDYNYERLNDTEDGLRAATQAELDIEADTELDNIVNFANVDPFLKAYVLAVNDGTIVPGMTNADLKAAVKAKL